MSACPNRRLKLEKDPETIVLRIDGMRLHLGRLEFKPYGRKPVCGMGCDLSTAIHYQVVDREILADADPELLCPELLRPVPIYVATSEASRAL